MKVKRVIFVVLSALVFALFLVFLELNKNTVAVFVLAAVITAGFYLIHRIVVKRKNKWYIRLGAWVGWLALLVGVIFVTWPPVKAVPAVSA